MTGDRDQTTVSISTISTTVEPTGSKESSQGLTLTLLYHPDVSRIGQMACCRFQGDPKEINISRLEPMFGDRKGLASAIDDRRVSRTRLRMVRARGGIAFWPQLPALRWSLDDDMSPHPGTFIADDRLQRGVVVGIGGVVLVLVQAGLRLPVEKEWEGLVGVSRQMDSMRRQVERLATSRTSVLLLGETGTGKEMLARAIHRTSGVRGAFIAVNLGAIPGTTAASQLFGHARGAFTGATGASGGYFGEANDGTLLLDEIGELPNELQPMLLRVLDSGEAQPVGGRPVKTTARVVMATDADLAEQVEEGLFRPALYYRVSSTTIDVAPLRKRPADVAVQAIHFLRQLLQELDDTDLLDNGWLGFEVMRRLVTWEWPGNSRELRAVMGRLVRENAHRTSAEAPVFKKPNPRRKSGQGNQLATVPPTEITKDEMIQALEACGYRPTHAARNLGIALNTLYARMRDHGIPRASDLTADAIERAKSEVGSTPSDLARALHVSERGLKLRMKALGL